MVIRARSVLVTIFALALVGGCLGPATSNCDNGYLCPAGLRCVSAGEAKVCVPPNCGNGRPDPGEACDDGDNVSGDGCPADCRPPCGDGIVDPREACDDGDPSNAGGCSSDCQRVLAGPCGNGLSEPGETCDDGNSQSHDGCSSRCSIEAFGWTPASAGVPKAGPGAMAYEPDRGVVVLFDMNRRTWEWDGDVWQRRFQSALPRVSAERAAMVYDELGRRLSLFSDFMSMDAYKELGAHSDVTTWWGFGSNQFEVPSFVDYAVAYNPARYVFILFGYVGADGETWESPGGRIETTFPVPGRTSAFRATPPIYAMPYDPRRQVVVMYTGDGLWTYGGTRWVLQPSSRGPTLDNQQIVYDGSRDRYVLYGMPRDGGSPETWEWNGTGWENKIGTAVPPPRLSPAIAYDAARRKVLLFGGRDPASSIDLNDTWEWDGNDWRMRLYAVPEARSRHAMTYDNYRSNTLMFGGVNASGQCLNDTWIWNGSSWRQLTPNTSPPPRADHAMVHDSHTTVLFGGTDCAGRSLGDTWEWDGTTWHERTSAGGPEARSGHVMLNEPFPLMIGGGTEGTLLSDQWVWDGARWNDVTPLTRPPPRRNAAVVYDPAYRKLLLFGGQGETTVLGDFWEWDGQRWTERKLPFGSAPSPRAGHTLVYNVTIRRVVLLGGHDDATRLNDVWVWDGFSWSELPVSPPQPPREHHAMVWDHARKSLVMFGGEDASPRAFNDTWFLGYSIPEAVYAAGVGAVELDEACLTGFDGDRDGKAGCADPDCGGTAPYEGLCWACGNQQCEAFESCRLCPVDCGPCRVCGDFICDLGENSDCPGDCAQMP